MTGLPVIVLPVWGAFALAGAACAWGLILGACAMLGPRTPGRAPAPAAPRPPLPRAGRFTLVQDRPEPPPAPPEGLWDTVPLLLLSEHYALIDATGREADQMDAAWRRKYLT